MLDHLRRLFRHAAWADGELLQAMRAGAPPHEAVREYAHIVGAFETWLARIEARAPRAAVWPAFSLDESWELALEVHRGYRELLVALDDGALGQRVAYTNTAGKAFETALDDILLHAAMHGHYHRGKVNVLLRQAGVGPANIDYITFVRNQERQ